MSLQVINTVLHYWGSRYQIERSDFERPHSRIFPEPKLQGKKIIYLYMFENVHVLRPDPDLIPQLETMLGSLPEGTKVDTAALQSFFGDGLSHEGDHPHLYLEKEKFQPMEMPAGLMFRHLLPEEYSKLTPFLARQSEEDIDNADITEDEHDPVIVCGFDGETIAAYSSFRFLSEYGGDPKYGKQIGDVGVLVDPPYRSRGYARAVVSFLSQWCLENGVIPQYQVAATHTHSYHIPLKLGYTHLLTAAEHHIT